MVKQNRSAGRPRQAGQTEPSVWQQVKYSYGAILPPSMTDWVAEDLSGKGSATRMVIRWAIPCVLILAPLMFMPAELSVRLGMTIPILLPYIFFTIALNRVYRRHRLAQHGLDTALVNKIEREKNADLYDEYHRKYRGQARPQSELHH